MKPRFDIPACFTAHHRRAAALCLALILTLSATAQQEHSTFRVVAISQSAEQLSVSNEVLVHSPYLVYIPNAFTPDGDGLNDTFTAKGQSIDRFYLAVYDRNGSMLYESSDPALGWDGTFRNEPLLAGSYTYFIEAENEDIGTFQRTGFILLVR